MNNKKVHTLTQLFITALLVVFVQTVHAQRIIDSTGKVIQNKAPELSDAAIDSILNKPHSPRKAAIKSAIIPGWGQVYNKKYWKVPIVYGALGTTAGLFVYNVNWYNRFRYAYKVLRNNDTANFENVHPQLQPVVLRGDENSLQYNRDEFRRNMDYSVLFFAVFWALNVVDATVDAHLKTFDVSPDLSLRFKPGYSDLAQTHGISLVLAIK